MSPRRLPAALALAAGLAGLAGCHTALEPTPAERRSSFRAHGPEFRAEAVQSLLQTCLVITAAPGARAPEVDPGTGALSVPDAAQGAYSQGLAVAVDRSGYLLTARHIVRGSPYVIGWMGGRLAVRPARVVALGRPSDPDEDSAVIAVDAPLDYCARLGPLPSRGQTVFAIVCNRSEGHIGGVLGMAAGTVLAAAGEEPGSPSLVATDVPLWHGDSGGPLLSASGELVGVNTAIRFAWSLGGRLVGGYVRYSCVADGPFLRAVIVADRARLGR